MDDPGTLGHRCVPQTHRCESRRGEATQGVSIYAVESVAESFEESVTAAVCMEAMAVQENTEAIEAALAVVEAAAGSVVENLVVVLGKASAVRMKALVAENLNVAASFQEPLGVLRTR